MKKILTIFAAAVAALTLASCNKDDSVYENNTAMGNDVKIEAMMAEDAQTKAADVKYATKANLESFQLGIFNGDETVTNSEFKWDVNPLWEATTAQPKPTTADSCWTNGNVYYWTANTYKFYAVAQSTGDKAVAYGSDNITKDGIVFDNRTVGASEDLIVAYTSGTQTSKVASLEFNHALARVRVAAKYTKDDKVKLQPKFVKWELQNVATTGTVTIDGTTVETSDIAWTPSATKVNVSDDQASTEDSAFLDADYRIVTGDKVADADANKSNRWVNVIPNAPKDANTPAVYATKLIATVEFYNEDGTLVGTRYLTASTDENAVAKLTYADGFKYQSGKAYTYKIEIVSNGGKDTDGDGNDPDDKPLDDFQINVTSIDVTEWKGVDGGSAKFGK